MDFDIERTLIKLTETLDLTDSQFDSIQTSYKTVGTLLNEDEKIKNLGGCKIFPHGSVALGTVVKPIKDNDYDVDMVCLLMNNTCPSDEPKIIVGRVLNESDRYKQMIKKEGSRCWTLLYKDYHMDIMPAMLSNNNTSYDGHACIIGSQKNKDNGTYTSFNTNPIGYKNWFISCCNKKILIESKRFSIENLKEYKNKTTLQQAVQLIKRHRDVYMEKNNLDIEFRPSSIIITTIAGMNYDGEENLITVIYKTINNLLNSIKFVNGEARFYNPINTTENFAYKWSKDSRYFEYFKRWSNQICLDFEKAKELKEPDLGLFLQDIFGKKQISSIYESFGASVLEARKNNDLKMDPKTGTLNTVSGVAVAMHTFYGEKKND